MPTDVRMDIPFLGGGPTIAEQILSGLHEGFAEKQAGSQLKLQQADLQLRQQIADVDKTEKEAQANRDDALAAQARLAKLHSMQQMVDVENMRRQYSGQPPVALRDWMAQNGISEDGELTPGFSTAPKQEQPYTFHPSVSKDVQGLFNDLRPEAQAKWAKSAPDMFIAGQPSPTTQPPGPAGKNWIFPTQFSDSQKQTFKALQPADQQAIASQYGIQEAPAWASNLSPQALRFAPYAETQHPDWSPEDKQRLVQIIGANMNDTAKISQEEGKIVDSYSDPKKVLFAQFRNQGQSVSQAEQSATKALRPPTPARVVTNDKGIPTSVVDTDGTTYDALDPNLPANLKGLVNSANVAHLQRNKEEVSQAGAKAGAEEAAKFPFELKLKQQEMAQNPVFAVNPATKQRELTTMGDAKAQGFTNPTKVSQPDVERETQLNAQLNDLQLNTSRYKVALENMPTLSQQDVNHISRILSDPDMKSAVATTAGMGSVLNILEKGSRAKDWNELEPAVQDALIGSLRMKNSALLFQKVSTGMGRASKEAMDIEIANMPEPSEGATVGLKKIQAFQENIDQMATRSVKLPWMEQSQDVKARIEGQGVANYNAARTQAGTGQYSDPQRQHQQGQYLIFKGKEYTVSKVYPDGSFDMEEQ